MTHFTRRIGPALALLTLSFTAVDSARADVTPPEEEACEGRSPGDSCEGEGLCQRATCSRLDYAHWDRDASAGPPTVTYECLTCSADAQADGDDVSADGSPALRDPPEDGTPDCEDSVSDDQASTRDEATSQGGCSVEARGLGRGFGPWLLALGSALLVSRRRR